MIDQQGRACWWYLDQEGRGIGLVTSCARTTCRTTGTTPWKPTTSSASGRLARLRDRAQILWDCGGAQDAPDDNNPKKIDGLKQLYDLEVVERVPI